MDASHYLLMGMPAGQSNPLLSFLPLVLIFVVFYFFLIRPQKKKEDQRKAVIESVKKGDKVVTIGGLHGTVAQVDEATLLIQVDTNTKLRIDKQAVANVVGKDAAA